MVKGKMKLIFAECLTMLKDCGYNVRARLLNAKHFGVPQSRERLIFIGTRSDLNIVPTHPKPVTLPVTVRQSLAEPIEGLDVYPKLSGSYPELMKQVPVGKNLAWLLERTENRSCGFNYQRLRWDKPCPTIPKSVTYSGAVLWHPDGHPLTGREIQRLASFPDSFQFVGTFKDWCARIGNCVPPLFMQAIASHVFGLIANSPNSQAGE